MFTTTFKLTLERVRTSIKLRKTGVNGTEWILLGINQGGTAENSVPLEGWSFFILQFLLIIYDEYIVQEDLYG